MENEDFSITCRTCLSSESEFIGLDTYMFESLTYLDCLNCCTNLGAKISDNLPTYICVDCRSALEVSFDFIKRSKNADDILRANLVTKVDDEEERHFNKTDLKTSFEIYETAGECLVDEYSIHSKGNLNDTDEQTIDKIQDDLDYMDQKCDQSDGIKAKDQTETKEEFLTLETPTAKGQWICKICSKVLLSRQYYEAHINKHLAISPYKCMLCSYESRYKCSFERHYKIKHKIEPSSEMLKTKIEFIDIVGEHADVLIVSESEECDPFNDISTSICKNNKLNTAEDKSSIEFENNKTAFTAKDVIDDKEDTVQPPLCDDTIAGFKCPKCSYAARSRPLIIQHLKEEHTNIPKATDECRAMILSAHKLKHDIPTKSIKPTTSKNLEKDFQCSYVQYNDRHTLTLHDINAHSENMDKKFQCNKCPSSFKCKDYLARHERTVHIQRKLKCNLCGRLFKLQFQLRAHLKRHSERIYQCQHCDKRYPRPVELKIHMRVHTGEKPYKCSMCDHSFNHASRLTLHFAAKHSIEVTRCPHCNEEFKGGKTSRYYTHMYQHTAHGLPYKCELCIVECDTRNHMRRHMKSAHKIDITTNELIRMFHKNTGRYAKRDLQLLNEVVKDDTR